jgi:hypothetical protein
MANTVEIKYGKRGEDGKVENVGKVNLVVPETKVCLSKLLAQVAIEAQSIARKADTPENAQEILDAWRPGVTRARTAGGVTKTELVKKLRGLTPDKLAALLEEAGIDLDEGEDPAE